MSKKKILLTGANGLLGQKLVSLILSEDKYELIPTGLGGPRFTEKEKVDFVTLDITDKENVDQVFEQYQPDYCINTAAMTNVDQCETDKEDCVNLNVNAVDYLVEACNKYDSFFLHLSTDFIFNGEDGPYNEEGVADPLSYYGESKLKAEEIVLEKSKKWAMARTVLVFGITPKMSRSNIVLWVKNSLESGKEIKVVNDQWRTPTLAEDLADGCYRIIDQEAEGIYNISGEEMLTPYDMAMQTIEFFNLDASLITEVDGSIFTQPAKRPPKTGFIIDKAKNNLGYKPRSFKEGIKVLAGQLEML